MRGLLPASVLAPRAHRTGVTAGYFRREMARAFPALAEEALRAPLLGELGIVDVEVLWSEVNRYTRSGEANLGVQLFFTLQTELWLCAREGSAGAGDVKDGLARAEAPDRLFI